MINPVNRLKEPITSIIGLLIIGFTVYNIYFTHVITWIWEGGAGLLLGLLCFLASDKLLGLVLDVFKGLKDKLLK